MYKLIGMVSLMLLWGCSHNPIATDQKHESRIRVTQKLLAPPYVPDHKQVDTSPPKIIEVHLTAEEKRAEVAPGIRIWFMTYNGSVPAPLIVAHQDDYVELTLENPTTNMLMHTIDLHAATGALGGAELAKVLPGQSATIRFKAIKPGVFVYHCAPSPADVAAHVTHGMNGAIMVLPRDGLKDNLGRPILYDRAYYIGEQDIYLPVDEKGHFRPAVNVADSMIQRLPVMKGLIPQYVVFNGRVGALMGDRALTAKVGEKVLFIHSEANRDSRPHLIGGHGDLVWPGGSFTSPPLTDQETWFVPGGSAVAALYEFRQPGTYLYLSHNLTEATMLGAVAQVKVEGDWNNDLMVQMQESGGRP